MSGRFLISFQFKESCVMATAAERLVDAGYEDVIVFENESYDDALVGVSHDGRAIYSFDKMVEWLCRKDGIDEEEAIEWIEYNTIRAIPYAGEKAPIVMYDMPAFEEEGKDD